MSYGNIISLDFELYNTKHYWSVCWAGVVLADESLNPINEFDVIINPGIKERFIGNDMSFPFSYKDLKNYGHFDEYSDRILKIIKPDTLIIGHAFENDVRMLQDVCHKFGLKPPSFSYIDTNILYNAVKAKSGEHSLKALGEEFGIEFTAHDPKEDARAALLIARACLGGMSMDDFIKKHAIETGAFSCGVMRKCLNATTGENQKRRIQNFNKIYECANSYPYNETGAAFYIDGAIAADYDTTEIVQKIIEQGGRLTATTYSADIVITNNLSLRSEPKYLPLKTVLSDLKLPLIQYDFSPHKVRDENGKPISLTEYYERAYSAFKRDGILSDKKVSFSRSSESRMDYEECILKIVRSGGTVCPRVNESDFFVVDNMNDLNKQRFDGRIKSYFMSAKPKAIEFDKMLDMLDKNNRN